MHEMAFVRTILSDVELLREENQKIYRVDLEVGELVGIEPDHLLEHLQELSEHDFNIITKKAKIRCPCGYEGPANILERLHDKVIFACPWCDEPQEVMKIVEGGTIKILKIHYS